MYAERENTHPVRKYPQFVGSELRTALKRTDADKIVHIGSSGGSGFFFIGAAAEYPILTFPYMLKRKVESAYSKINPDEGIIFIIEGQEQGRFWTLDEYRRAKK